MDRHLTCAHCGVAFAGHANRRHCDACRHRYGKCIPKLSPEIETKIRRLAGTMYVRDLAAEVGLSKPTITRWARANGVNVNALRYKPAVIKAVVEYYAKHGKLATQRRFKNVRLRSIVERYAKGLNLRQRRWTDNELVLVAKLGGLVSHEQLARFLDRPNAHRGSIVAVWNKRFPSRGINLNGLAWNTAKHLVLPHAPVTRVRGERNNRARRVLWVHVETFLRPEVPDHLRQAIAALARFQRWLHGSQFPQLEIERLLKEAAPCQSPRTISSRQTTASSTPGRSSRRSRVS